MSNKTSKEDFRYFSEKVIEWAESFGLLDYEFAFDHRDFEADKEQGLDGGRAAIFVDLPGKVANVLLALDWGKDEVTKKELDRSALHEMIHLLLYELIEVVKGRLPSLLQEATEHGVVRRLENMILGID